MGNVLSKKYYYIYQTINTVNGKTYIGVHGTNNMNDGYIGCGIYRQSDADREMYKKGSRSQFIKSVVKYGYDSFKRYELDFFDSMEEAMNEERIIVNEKWVKDRDNYNSCGGGMGRRYNKLTKKHQHKLIDIHSKEYVVYDTLEDKVYFVKNLHNFCRENGINSVPTLFNVITGGRVLCKKRYWACRKQDWKGYPEIRDKANKCVPFKKYKIRILRPDGVIDDVENISSYCKENKLDPSSMYKMAKGMILYYRGYTIIN